MFDDRKVFLMHDPQTHAEPEGHPDSKPHPDHKLTIVVVDGEGDEATVTLNAHQHLAQLLREGLAALLGEPVPDPGDYDLLIGGTPVSDLTQTLMEVALKDGSEVVIMAKDVSRG
jgi:hypothetical protein